MTWTDRIRCEFCGKFMSELDLEVGHCDFTPDTAFSSEKVEWHHKKCWEEFYADIPVRLSSGTQV